MSLTIQPLHAGWQLIQTPPGSLADPEGLKNSAANWREAVVPGTVAQSLGTRIDETVQLDASDWWYRTSFDADTASGPGITRKLRFEGLATLADVWLNGTAILSSRNMFVSHLLDVTHLLRDHNELVIRFRSLDAELAQRKPRPRWKTALITQQNLRFVRTTLLGRIPGWSPPIQPVGPWKSVTLETSLGVDIESPSVRASVHKGVPRATVSSRYRALPGTQIRSACLKLGVQKFELILKNGTLDGQFDLPDAPLWWPHTHGEPALVSCAIEISLSDGTSYRHDCGKIGFKSVTFDRTDGQVQLVVNGVPIFARGACWTVGDILSLTGSEAHSRKILVESQRAGLNMIRIGGTMTYETDTFYRLCDELGILVWQDFMFANMDYPVADADFRAEIEKETRQQLERLQKHACIAVYCGGSEVQQQSAMMGLPETMWSNDFFEVSLRTSCETIHPGIPYFPSSPCEGALPFQVSKGISHYYGVGAYLRPISDVKQASVKFTAECLGFSNIPSQSVLEELGGGSLPVPHSPLWKRRVPRDSGAGWDFEDVRDHYLRELFKVDPITLRSQDLERYYEVSRAVTGEVMKSVYAEWRRPESGCGGALIWFLNDLWPGAGWGIIDSHGNPKAVLHSLKRAWSPRAILITDHGLDGLNLNVVNETQEPLHARVLLELFSHQSVKSASVEKTTQIPARGALTLEVDALLGYFADITGAYHFGPPKYDVVQASVYACDSGELISEDFYFPQGLNFDRHRAEVAQMNVASGKQGQVVVTVRSEVFLQTAHLSASGYEASDNFFHLAPAHDRQVIFTPTSSEVKPFKVELTALNLRGSITARLATGTSA